MATSAVRVILLALSIGIGVRGDGVTDTELRQRVAELQRLISEDNTHLTALEKAPKRARRLEESPRTIYETYETLTGDVPYSQNEKFAGALDHFWLILCGALVMFMQGGFAMVEAGCCRAKNVQAILLKNFTDVAAGTFGWWIFGYSFAFSGPMDADGFKENGFMGYEAFAGHTFIADREPKDDTQLEPSTQILTWFFQWAFCSASATIVSGGVAERVNFAGYCIFSLVMTSWIYPIVVAWTWGYGWLANINDVGYMDFAGSGIVHLTGGVGALVGAAIAGARKDRFKDQTLRQRLMDTPDAFIPHSMPLVVLGTFILWFGWYGFNCGSTLSMATKEKGMLAAQVAMNSTMAASVGGMAVFGLRYAMCRKYDIGGLCNGILAGLVSITAPCGNVETGSAILIGLIGALFFQGASSLLRACKIDDPVDAFAVHGACGWWGVMAAALFDWGKGFDTVHGWNGFKCLGYDAEVEGSECTKNLGGQLIVANLAEVFAIIGWVGIWCALLFFILKMMGILREIDSTQDSGSDLKKHSPSKGYAYGGSYEDDQPLHSI